MIFKDKRAFAVFISCSYNVWPAEGDRVHRGGAAGSCPFSTTLLKTAT